MINEKLISTLIGSKLEDNGYIKFANGFLLQWKTQTITAGGTAWGNVYYSDHEMGNWSVNFTKLFVTWSNIETPQHWCTNANQTKISAGLIRTFRPNAGTISTKVNIFGLGMWK